MRSPAAETRRTRAPRAASIGAESEAEWAQQRGELGATQHTVPASFMQKSMLRRHSSVWL